MKIVNNLLALAVAAALLPACQRDDGGAIAPVEQLNNLKGATRDLAIDLREGTNMAAAPSPDGTRIVFSAQGALWIMAAKGGFAQRITD